VSESRECVGSRVAASEGRVIGHEMLNVVGTLLKGGKRLLEIRILLVTLLRNYFSEFQSFNFVGFLFLMRHM